MLAITLAIHLVIHLARLDSRSVVTEVVRVCSVSFTSPTGFAHSVDVEAETL
jgi:hypothetical protein